jgi:hypothetical protein
MSSSANSDSALGANTSGALTQATVAATSAALASPASQAVHVASVKTHVPVVLDLQKSNYAKWRMLITVLLGKYDLAAHITALTPAADRTAEWQRQDYVVRSWLYGSISEDILDTIMAQDQTAYEGYALIRNLFLDNQLTRAVYLEAQFRAIVQGDLTVTAYCHRLKALSDALADVGQPVTDQTLVLTCLRGLNPRFSDITTLVTMQVPAPNFLQTRSLLLLRENQLANSAPGGIVPSQVALYGQTAGPSTGGNQGGNGGNGGRWQKKKKAVTGGAPGSNAAYPAAAPGPWICFNPYTGQTQAMQPTWRPSGAPAWRTGPSWAAAQRAHSSPAHLGPSWPAGLRHLAGPSAWAGVRRQFAAPGDALQPRPSSAGRAVARLGLLRAHRRPEQHRQHLQRRLRQRRHLGHGLGGHVSHGQQRWYTLLSLSALHSFSCHRRQRCFPPYLQHRPRHPSHTYPNLPPKQCLSSPRYYQKSSFYSSVYN